MEKFKPKTEQCIPQPSEKSLDEEKELIMEDFYKKHIESVENGVKKITLDDLKELKEMGITTEEFLNFLCRKKGLLLHGSVYEISDNKLKSHQGKIFASNKAAIAIMKSLYSNINVNLEYPYYINEKKPLVLKIHTSPDGKFIKTERGFVYLVNETGFRNDPKNSWQFIKENDEVEFVAVVETEDSDFKYPVNFFNDFNLKK